MRIVAIEKFSLIDYPRQLAAVFFTPGCNLNCFYCHNRALLMASDVQSWMGAEVALAWLDDRKGFLDGVVITGGEPTLQPGLAEFIRVIRSKGYLVKLDTNGTRPEVLQALLDEGLLDYVAMDLKAPRERYAEICGAPVDSAAIDKSIALLIGGSVDYEFRTTVAPQLEAEDILAMAGRIQGARRYILQQFRRPAPEASAFNDPRNAVAPHTSRWPEEVLDQVRLMVETCETRGFDAAERTPRAPEPTRTRAWG